MTRSSRNAAIVVRPDGDAGALVPGAGTMGVWLFVGSLSVFFLASLAAYIAVRVQAETWPPSGMPGLPAVLWASTSLLVASSATLHLAHRAVTRGDTRWAARALLVTLTLGVAFLASQAWAWYGLVSEQITARSNLWAFTFFVLTALHGIHVIGGLVPLAVTTVRARRGRYTWARHAGVRNCAIYWHFLGGVWLTLFMLLVIVH